MHLQRTRNTTNFNDLMSDLTITVNMTTQVIDQNTVNIQVVQAVFAETAAQVQSLAFMISVEEVCIMWLIKNKNI